MVFIILTCHLSAQNFITKFYYPSATTSIQFNALTNLGGVGYTWTASPSGNSGSGSFVRTAAGAVSLSGLNILAGDTVILSMNPINLRRFYFDNQFDRLRIVDVLQWGSVPWSDMNGAFSGCSNLDISATDLPDLSNVISLRSMFQGCSRLNGPNNIGAWNTSKVKDLFGTFSNAILFNQDIGSWDVSNVTSMTGTFFNAEKFNQDISNWVTDSVQNMNTMFAQTDSFNQDISSWNTAMVSNFSFMFIGAKSFNQDIGSWDVSSGIIAIDMFSSAISFNQDLGDWILHPFVNFQNFFSGSGMDCFNYSATLKGWHDNNPTVTNRNLGATGLQYGINAATERNNLVSSRGWTISGDSPSTEACVKGGFITEWTFPTLANSVRFNAQTAGGPVNYYWSTSPSGNSGSGSFTLTTAGFITLTGFTINAGDVLTLSMEPQNLRRFFIANSSNRLLLTDVLQWGEVPWTNWSSGFTGCANLQISATDVPDLSNTSTLFNMFNACSSLNGPANINDWDLSTITSTSSMFNGASSFNQNLDQWDMSNVTVASNMFLNASSFNQNLGGWTLNNSINMSNMLSNSGLDCANYSATLEGWHDNNPSVINRNLGASGLEYGVNALFERNNLVGLRNWTISGDVSSTNFCGETGFRTVWNFPSTATSLNFSALTVNSPVEYNWIALPSGNRGSGSFIRLAPGALTLSGLNIDAGDVLELSLDGENLRRFFLYNSSDVSKLADVTRWGDVPWSSMENAFFGAINLNITATDLPNLDNVTSLSNMFNDCTNLNGPANIGAWNTSNVQEMVQTFSFAKNFNQDISAWNTSNVTNMYEMFGAAHRFNQDLSSWDTHSVSDMTAMFAQAFDFNQNIGNWNMSSVQSTAGMFIQAIDFDQDLSAWEMSQNTNMLQMFRDATSFNQNLGAWTLNPGVVMDNMFDRAGMDCKRYAATLNGWATNNSSVTGRNLGAADIGYDTLITPGRATLMANGWTIVGDTIVENCSELLPVELLSFEAGCAADGVELEWATATEVNNDYFTIEVSMDGNEWDVLGEIAGMGNSNAVVHYRFIHDAPQNDQAIYYRLKQTDYNGQFKYFEIQTVKCSSQISMYRIYPNPSKGHFTIEANESFETISLFDLKGEKLWETKVADPVLNELILDFTQFSEGVYFLRMENAQGLITFQKISIQ